MIVRRLLERVSLRWQLALMYVASLSAVLALLGMLLYREVDIILVSSVYHQLESDAGPILSSGELQPAPPVVANAWGPPAFYLKSGLKPRVVVDGTALRPIQCPAGAGGCAPKAPSAQATTSPATAAPASSVSLDRLVATDVGARFLGLDGQVLGQAGNAKLLDQLSTSSTQTFGQAISARRSLQFVVGQRPSRVAVLIQPARTPQGSDGVLLLGASLDQVDLFLSVFKVSLIVGIFAALGTGTAVGLWATRRFLEPLDRMAAVSRTVAAGNLRGRFVGTAGSSEVRTLAGSFNHMIDRLDASLSSQRQFTADAAHELRTPLTSLGGSVELLLIGADGGEPERTQKMLRSMDLEIQRLTRLVNDLLQLSRMEGNTHTELARVDVAELTQCVAGELRLIGPQVRVVAEGAGPLPVFGDRDRLKQVLLNIGENALKFTPSGGVITLRVERAGSLARVCITDTGPGISRDDLPHIFDRFYRSDPSRARASGGMGLGLAIALAIVQAHKGTIRVASPPGEGATFYVELPLSDLVAVATTPKAAWMTDSGLLAPTPGRTPRRRPLRPTV